MDDRKICFISCVNNVEDYEECLLYLKQLDIPNGMEIEVLSIEQADSMTAGYSSAMHSSNAKYKIYLHQDVYIIKHDFLYDILRIFRKHRDVGLIGLAGSAHLPDSAIWWQDTSSYMHLAQIPCSELIEVQKKGCIESDFAYMEAVDGLLMATQYDVEWREDVFKGWHFYDISACMEFLKAGYRIAVPRQDKPWCIHECGSKWLDDGYLHWRQVFWNTYGINC